MSTTTYKQTPVKKYLKWGIFALLAIIIAAIAYYFLRPKEAPPSYLTATVELGDIEQTVMATGKVKAINSVDVGAQVSGEVTKLYVDVGSEVAQGDLIAQIDEVGQKNSLANAEASLSQSQSQLSVAKASLASKQGDVQTALTTIAQREAELKKAESYYQRLQSLIAIEAVAQKDVDDAAADFEVAKANLESAKVALANAKIAVASASADIDNQRAAVGKSQTDVNTAQKDLGYTTIRAPMAGTVVSVTQKQGTTVNANQSAPTIITLADLSRVRINAQISEADVINIKAGMPARFNMIGDTAKQMDAVLTGIEPAPEEISSTSSTDSAVYYIGYLDVDNTEGKFRIDMTAQVNIIINSAKNVIVIPSAAISTQNGKSTVQVVGADGFAKPVEVVVGIDNRVNAEIKSGLNQGDTIVIGQGGASTGSTNSRGGPPMM